MPYNFAAGNFHTKKLCSRLSSRKANFDAENGTKFAFEAPFGGLESNVRCSSYPVGDFLFVIIEVFSLGAFVLSHTRV